MAMKDFKTGRSHSDLMDRIVFGIPKAPQDKIEFQRLVERMRLPRGDTFPIIAAGMDEIMIMPDMYVPIMKRLQEKACMFFRNKIENMNEKEKEIWKMSGTDFIEEDAGSWWTSILILVIFFIFCVWFISRWFDEQGDGGIERDNKLLNEKISDVDDFTRQRLHKTEELNTTLLEKVEGLGVWGLGLRKRSRRQGLGVGGWGLGSGVGVWGLRRSSMTPA